MKKIAFLINLLFFYTYFNYDMNINTFTIPQNLEIGDLILREGTGSQSLLISKITHSKYTHIGIISSIHPIKILHATYDDLGENGVKEFSIKDFFKGAKQIKIIRLIDLSKEEKLLLIKNLKKYLNQDFNLSPKDNNLYCTTFIYKELEPLITEQLEKTYLDIPIATGYYLLPKSFLNLNHIVIDQQIDYFK